MNELDLARYLDATLLAAEATAERIEALARDADRLGCAAVCISPVHVRSAFRALAGSEVRVASVAGFPLGASPASSKIDECRFALDNGASELDIVIPIWAAVAGELSVVEDEIAALLAATVGSTRKMILETALLPPGKLEAVAGVVNRLRPEFVKTGTGYARPVTPGDVASLRRLVDPAIGVKASGGIRTRDQAEALIVAGAIRIGSSRVNDLLG